MTAAPQPTRSTPPATALAAVQKYGNQIHLIAPATDRHTAPNELMVPYPTQVRIDPHPDNGEVFKVGSKRINGAWTDQLTLSKTTLERIAQAAGVVWDSRLTGLVHRDAQVIIYRAVGYVRMPDGSLTRISGTREIDLDVIHDEMQMLQARKVLDWGRDQKGNPYPHRLTPEQKADVDDLVSAELIEFRKHRMARAETGAKNRAVRSLGLKSTYTPAELKAPYVVVRWGLNPAHDYAQAEMRQLWDHEAPAMPQNPLPAPDSLLALDSGEDIGTGLDLDDEERTPQAAPETAEAVDGEVSDEEQLHADCLDMLESLPDAAEQKGWHTALEACEVVEQYADLKANLIERCKEVHGA